jgi:uncharacterized NAD(P)/FAD-binding protein YdhS
MQELGKLIPTQETVLIVGAGFMGTATAIRLLHHAQFPLEIILLEKEDEQRCGGLAYSRSCAGWEHLLNIQAGRITLFREHPNDFLEWANLESNRSQWPEKWQKTKFHETSAVPRIIYQQYVHERLIQAQKKAFKDVTLTWMSGEAVDIIEQEKTAIVTIISSDDNQNRQITKREVEQVILATGHREAVLPVFAQNFKEHPRFVLDQYSQRGQKIIHNIDPNETVFILGTALSSFDAILSLLAQNHQGQIVLCSRHGFTHFTYPSNHLHEIVKLPRPSFLDNDNLCLESLKEEVSEAYKQAFSILKQNRTDIDESVLSERILKAWEPYIVELVNRLQPEKIQKLLNEHNSLIVTKRIGTIPEIGNSIAAKIHSFKKTPSQIRMIKGEITKIEKTENSHRLKIEIKQIDPDDIHSIKVGYVISCLGRKSDYRQIQSPLWRNLIDVQKLAIPHQKTGRGIEVGDYGEVINAQGKPSQILYAVGPMRQGDEIEKRGRSGAFVFSLGTIRNQALITALKVLEMLKEKKNEQTKGFPSLNLNPKSEKVGKLIANEAVKRTQKPLTEVEKYGLKKSIKQIINSVLYGQLIVHKLEALVTLEPQDREVFEQKIMAVAKQLKTLLVATGLEENLIQDVVAETTKQAQKIAIYRLTDISKLAGTALCPEFNPSTPKTLLLLLKKCYVNSIFNEAVFLICSVLSPFVLK